MFLLSGSTLERADGVNKGMFTFIVKRSSVWTFCISANGDTLWDTDRQSLVFPAHLAWNSRVKERMNGGRKNERRIGRNFLGTGLFRSRVAKRFYCLWMWNHLTVVLEMYFLLSPSISGLFLSLSLYSVSLFFQLSLNVYSTC